MTNKPPPQPPNLSGYRPNADHHGQGSGHGPSHAPAHPQGTAHGHGGNVPPPGRPPGGGGPPHRRRRPPGARPPSQRSPSSGLGLGSFLLYGLVAVIAIISAGLVYLVISPPTDLIRSQFISAVKSKTGRDLTINGATSISFYPSIGISMGDVALSPPPGMKGDPTAEIKNLTVAVKLLPLLSKEVVVDTLVLTQPVFDLRIDANGQKSWDFAGSTARPRVRLAQAQISQIDLAQATATDAQAVPPEAREFLENATDTKPAKPASSVDLAALEQLRLGDVRIIDGTIRYADIPGQVTEQIDAINVQVGLTSISAPLTASGDLGWKGEKIDFDATLTSLKSILKQSPAKLIANINARPVTAVYDGTIHSADTLTLDGAISADSTSLRALTGWLGTALPQARGFGPMTMQGRLKANGATYSILNANIGLDGATATGTATLATGGARPYIKADLKLSELDLNKYLHAGESGTSADPGSQGDPSLDVAPGNATTPQVRGYTQRAGWSQGPIDMSSLGLVDADVNLLLGRLLYEKIKVGRSRLVVALKDAKMRADLSEMSLYDGKGRGVVILDAKTPKASTIAANFAVNDVAVQPLLTDAADIGWVAGTGNLTLAVTGHAVSQHQIINTLNGKTTLQFNNGAIIGFNVPELMRNIAQGKLGGLDRTPSQKTDFSEMSASFDIANGIASNTDLLMASPLLRVTGAGKIMLPDQTVDYIVKPKLVSDLEGQGGQTGLAGVVVPVRIHGPFGNLSYSPDVAGLLENPDQVVDTVKQIGEKLKNLKGKKPQEILDGLFGGGSNTEAEGESAAGEDGGENGGGKIDAKKLLEGLFGN